MEKNMESSELGKVETSESGKMETLESDLERELKMLKESYVQMESLLNETEKRYCDLKKFCQSCGIDVPSKKDEKSFCSTFYDEIGRLFNNSLYSDLKIILEGGVTLSGHKVVLSSRSHQWVDDDLDTVQQLDFSGIRYDLAHVLIKWLYTDDLETEHLNESFLIELLHMAAEFKLYSLKIRCERLLLTYITTENMKEYYKLSQDLCCSVIREFCLSDNNLKLDNKIEEPKMSEISAEEIVYEDINSADEMIEAEVIRHVPIEEQTETVVQDVFIPNLILKTESNVITLTNNAVDSSIGTEALRAGTLGTGTLGTQTLGKNLTKFVKQEIDPIAEVASPVVIKQIKPYRVSKQTLGFNSDTNKSHMERSCPATSTSVTKGNSGTLASCKGSYSKSTPIKSSAELTDVVKLSSESTDAVDDVLVSPSKTLLLAAESSAPLVEDAQSPGTSASPKASSEPLVEDAQSPGTSVSPKASFVPLVEDAQSPGTLASPKASSVALIENAKSRTSASIPASIESEQCATSGLLALGSVCNKEIIQSLKLSSTPNDTNTPTTQIVTNSLNSQDADVRKSPRGRKLPSKSRTQNADASLVAKLYKCDFCSKSYQFASYKRHVRIVHKQEPKKKRTDCNKCGKTFKLSSQLEQHFKRNCKAPVATVKPPSKDKAGLTVKPLSKEKAGVTVKPPSKNNDGVTVKLPSKETAGLTVKFVVKDKPVQQFSCPNCLKVYKVRSSLRKHMRIHDGDLRYKCDVCNKYMRDKTSLTIHTRSHTGEKPYQCNVCSKSFQTNSALNSHVMRHGGIKPFCCEFCGKDFATKSQLIMHVRIHTGDKPFKCHLCDKRFSTARHLPRHLRSHMGIRPFQCDKCGKSFSENSVLQNHIRQHLGIRPHKCNICSKSFSQTSHLNKHMKSHMGEKEFVCEVCSKEFYHKCHLERHQIIHSGKKPFVCSVCDRSFARDDYLQKHKSTHVRKF